MKKMSSALAMLHRTAARSSMCAPDTSRSARSRLRVLAIFAAVRFRVTTAALLPPARHTTVSMAFPSPTTAM